MSNVATDISQSTHQAVVVMPLDSEMVQKIGRTKETVVVGAGPSVDYTGQPGRQAEAERPQFNC